MRTKQGDVVLIPGVAVGERRAVADGRDLLVAYVSTRQHTSAYVGIRQHTSAYVCIRQHTSSGLVSTMTSAYVCIRLHTSAYV